MSQRDHSGKFLRLGGMKNQGQRHSQYVPRFASTIIVTGLLAVASTLGTGCTHIGRVTHSVSSSGRQVYTSTLRDDDGLTRATVRETVVGSDDQCDILRIERLTYDSTGMLVERTLDRERCSVVEYRLRSVYDLAAGRSTTVTSVDRDHDGRFDAVATVARSVSDSDLALLRP